MQEPPAPTADPPSGKEKASPSAARPLQWLVGALFIVVGALMWLAPHQFSAMTAVFGDDLLLWGAAYFAGSAALAGAALTSFRPLTAAAHAAAAALLGALAAGSAAALRWPDAASIAALALTMALAPLLSAVLSKTPFASPRDFTALAAGLAAAAAAAAALSVPGAVAAPSLPWTLPAAAALLGACLILIMVRLLPAARWPVWPAHVTLGLSVAAYGFGRAAPDRDLLVISWYGGVALAVGLAPWAAPRLAALDPASLRTRLALALAAASSLPVILAATLTTRGEERVTLLQALAQQETLAASFAHETTDYIGLHRGAVAALAAVPGLLDLPALQQQALLQNLHGIYPDLSGLSLLDPERRQLARSGDGAGLTETPAPVLDELRRTWRPTMAAAIASFGDAPSFVLAAPVLDAGGTLRGAATATLTSGRLLALLQRAHAGPAASTYLVDSRGRAIAHPNPEQVGFLADLSAAPPVAALLASDAAAGALIYKGAGGRTLASFARTPALGWGVVVERSEAEALAGMRFRRDAAFVTLLLGAGLAGLAGAAAASGLTRPLHTLAGSVERLNSDEGLALPQSSVREISALAGALALLRDRLAARTAEREQALERLGASERRFRLLAEHAQDIVYRYRRGPAPGFEYLNPAAAAVSGYAPEEFAADPEIERRVVAPDDWALWQETMQTGEGFDGPVTLRWARRDGAVVWLEWRQAPVRSAAGAIEAVEGVARDVTERRRAETALRNANRALLALAAGVRVLESAAAEPELLRQICSAAVETGGYRTAWIGLVDGGETRAVRQAAQETSGGPSPWPAVAAPQDGRGSGPLALALETGAPVAAPDLAADRRFAAWAEMASAAGDGAAVAFPLLHDGALLGALALSAAGAGAFDREATEILAALAGDLAAGLAARRARLQRDQTEAALLVREDQYRALFNHSLDAVLLTAPDGRVVAANPAACALFGYSASAIRERSRADLLDLSDPRWAAALEERERAGRFAAEVRMRRSDGAVFPAEVSGAAFPGRDGRSLTSLIVRDISERRRAEEEQRYQALHDALTGLPNRAHLELLLDAAVPAAAARGQTAALVLLDVQRFREVNDAFGHAAGDALLREISRRLQRTVRQSDALARLAGDEFAVLAPNLDSPALAGRVAQRLLEALAAPFLVEGVDFAVRTVAGVALAPQHETGPAALLRCAGVALRSAKASGAASAVYDPAQERDAREQLALMGELRRALEDGELELHYQPQASLATGEIAGVEALVRWRHPQRGFILPATFVTVVERTGLTGDLTRWVLDAAARQLSQWRRAGLDLTVAVNLSAPDLLAPDLPEQIAAALGAWSVPADRLTVELAEAAAAADLERAGATLRRLRAMGVRVALDEVDAAASSLALLRRLPADDMKIESAVALAGASGDQDAAVEAALAGLGRRLGLQVTAKGVEDRAAWERLAALGCDRAQGYYLSRPLPAGELTAWLAERTQHPGKAQP